MRTKQIKGNKMTVANGFVTYISSDGFKIVRGVSDYDNFGDHVILEAVYNLAHNNIQGHELTERFEAWLKNEPEPKTFFNPYSLYNIQ